MTPIVPPVDSGFLLAVRDIAVRAGDTTLKWFRTSTLEVETKEGGSPVTVADRYAERMIREEIAEKFPHSVIVGEEEGVTHADAMPAGAAHAGADAERSSLTWYIDPIDGTVGFVRGVPLYTTLLAVDDAFGPAVGVVHVPATGETLWAGRGLGAHTHAGPARVSAHAALEGAIVTSSEVGRWPSQLFAHFQAKGASIRGWGDGFGFYMVATGHAEAMIDIGHGSTPHPWDFAPFPVIFSEAGGKFFDPTGECNIHHTSGAASNAALAKEVEKCMNIK